MKYKLLRFSLLSMFVMLFGGIVQAADPEVTLDFTSSATWGIPTTGNSNTELASFTDGTYTIKLYAANNYKQNSSYLILGKSGSYLELPAFSFDVEKIEVVGSSGASAQVKQNIYVGETAVSTETTGATGTNSYEIAEAYQAAGNVYQLKVTSNQNTQISKILIYKKAAASDTRTATTIELSEGYATSGAVGGTIELPTATVKAGDDAVEGAAVTWSSSNEAVAAIDGSNINLVAAGTAKITATYAGDDTYQESTASFTVTVMVAYTSLKALQEAVTATSTPAQITFNDVFVTAVKGSNAYIADADGYGALIYTSGHGLEAGQVLNGTIDANIVLYRGQTEITNFTTEGLTITTTELTPTVKTIDQITAANQSTLVTLKGVKYDDDKLTDGTNEITYYNNFNAFDKTNFDTEKTYDVTGIVILFNSTLELAPRTADDVVEAASTEPETTKSYYVVGNMTDWGVDENYKMTLNAEADTEEYYINMDLTTDNQLKIVAVDGDSQTWYPNGMGNSYGENGEITANGNYDIYFRPNNDGGDDWFYGCIYVATHGSAVEEPTLTGISIKGSTDDTWAAEKQFEWELTTDDETYAVADKDSRHGVQGCC